MIVYSGKQFWNDFNNWDEGLFQDANRPRDDDKFQIRPWVNSRKNDLRVANSWIAAQGTFYWLKVQAWQSTISWNTAYMKNKYTASDISDVNSFVAIDGTTYNANYFLDQMNAVILWKPYVNADGYITIWKWGVYAVTCNCLFVAPTWYNVVTSYDYKFYVAMMINGWVASMWTQSRGCWWQDSLSVFYVGWFDAGDTVNTWFLHTYTTKEFLCQPTINLYRLS